MLPEAAIQDLQGAVGSRAVLHRDQDLLLYEYDGSIDKGRPECVVFPRTTDDVVRVVKIAAEYDLPLVGRGAGTGLSGGVIPTRGGLMIGFSRMNRILEIDCENECAVVQPGVVNLDITRAVQSQGYYYAPDPSSQKACTIGGNVAENAGGPHTLIYGVTTNHVLGIEAVMPDGTVLNIGGKEQDLPGYDLTGLLTGSEGTMALVTKVIVRLMRAAESVETLLAIYERADDAASTVGELTARAITPAAVEMLDGVMLRMVEEATHAGFPMDAEAVLLIELEGIREAVVEQLEEVNAVCLGCRAREVRVAKTADERALLWKGRKNAFGAVGRVSPTYYVQDGVVPRTRIADTLRHIYRVSEKYGLTISNIFHAGDGNMHPIILFDPRSEEETLRTRQAGEEILRYCIEVGGAITGEHGVGMEKNELMPLLFAEDSLEQMERLMRIFNPDGRLNPGKILPTGKGCLEVRLPPAQHKAVVW
ncbi:MAG: FAD-binding protein [Bryobacterales bacterium]|nr:FAD-binding protein [Bryobacterales bacterium]